MRKIDVEELRVLAGTEGWYIRRLSKHFGVRDNAILGACRRHKIVVPRRQNRKIDPEKLTELLKSRRSFEDMAEVLGVTRSAVSVYVKRHHPKYTPPRQNMTAQQIKRMEKMIANGVSSECLISFFGFSRGAIFRAVARHHGKGRRSPRMLKAGVYGQQIPEAELGVYSEVIRKKLYAKYPRNREQVDAGVALASTTMQEIPEQPGWKTLFMVTAQRRTVDEIRSHIGRDGKKASVRNASALENDYGAETPHYDDTSVFIRQKIGELESKFAEVLYTLLDTEFDHGETIERLGLPESTYYARLSEAKKLLREVLPDELAETISER